MRNQIRKQFESEKGAYNKAKYALKETATVGLSTVLTGLPLSIAEIKEEEDKQAAKKAAKEALKAESVGVQDALKVVEKEKRAEHKAAKFDELGKTVAEPGPTEWDFAAVVAVFIVAIPLSLISLLFFPWFLSLALFFLQASFLAVIFQIHMNENIDKQEQAQDMWTIISEDRKDDQ